MADIGLSAKGGSASRHAARPAVARIIVQSTVTLVVAANLVAIVWLWLHNGGVTGVHSLADGLTSVGRITGLLGGYFLLLQVLLLSRLPLLEYIAPFDRLTVWHGINGKLCLYLVLAHVVFITIGYALLDGLTLTSEITVLLTQYSGMVTATVGTVLLILVVISSLIIVRRRLR